jgi:hypothetical protein
MNEKAATRTTRPLYIGVSLSAPILRPSLYIRRPTSKVGLYQKPLTTKATKITKNRGQTGFVLFVFFVVHIR